MDFEKKLLESGSLELICSYVTEHSDIVSEKFKTALTGKIKGILQALDLDRAKYEILDMDVELFIDKFYEETYSLQRGFIHIIPKVFFEQCKENHIFTAGDLLKYGHKNVVKMRRVGIVTIIRIEEAFERAGISGF